MQHVGTPAAWFENGVWYLFYERDDVHVYLATSTDGGVTWINWSEDPVLPLGPSGSYDAGLVAANQIVKVNGIYYMYYHASASSNGGNWTMNIAASNDLKHWEKYSVNPIVTKPNSVEGVSSGIILHDGQKYRMYTTEASSMDVYFQR